MTRQEIIAKLMSCARQSDDGAFAAEMLSETMKALYEPALFEGSVSGDAKRLRDEAALFRAAAEMLEAMTARVAELEAASAWQPIATAPQRADADTALIGRVNSEGQWVTLAIWHPAWDRDSSRYHRETHWMPLPPPPPPPEAAP